MDSALSFIVVTFVSLSIQELGVTRYAGRVGCLLIVKENSALNSRVLRQL